MLSQETEKSIRMYVIKMKKKKQRRKRKKNKRNDVGKKTPIAAINFETIL